MPYEDYKERQWKVIEAGSLSSCPEDSSVTFTGPATAVILHCKENTPYPEGRYVDTDGANKIQSDQYEIVMTGGHKPQITFTPKGSVGGSWTAEDSTPGPDSER